LTQRLGSGFSRSEHTVPRQVGRRSSGQCGTAGQGLVEYTLILVVMAVVCVISLVFFGDQLSALLSLVAGAV